MAKSVSTAKKVIDLIEEYNRFGEVAKTSAQRMKVLLDLIFKLVEPILSEIDEDRFFEIQYGREYVFLEKTKGWHTDSGETEPEELVSIQDLEEGFISWLQNTINELKGLNENYRSSSDLEKAVAKTEEWIQLLQAYSARNSAPTAPSLPDDDTEEPERVSYTTSP